VNQFKTHVWTLLFAVGAVGFALTAHRDVWLWWRWGCLTLAGAGLCGAWAVVDNPVEVIFGKPRMSRLGLRVFVVGCLGAVAAVGYRLLLETPPFPSSFHWFVVMAMGIGLTEELLWRGWMQGSLAMSYGPLLAVSVTAASHTAYKAALFAFPPTGEPMRTTGAWLLTAALTLGFGAMLGCFRIRQGTVLAPVAFHVIFDLLVYAEYTSTPWWVL